ncbi:putative sodium/metabolite cotransporter BASS4, chloroplastic [Apostasia shenzhenica]|uniref:Putative sodium/metabolite cotransporter BASS4, chloroplastic n=1 Tax=Apostasia shenzhenica TaxID=1088818 RepID=A0A2I0AP41_9ASPA|nr:putative sodium/metabolite cotransporter BASS4, chloroplastic [Apostasia shenzhenica]
MSPRPLEMVGTIQILGFRLPTSVRRLDLEAPSAPLMVSRVRLLRHHVFPSALPTLSVEVHPVIRRPRASSGFDLVDDSRHCNANNFGPPELFIWGKLLLNFARNNFLPLALVSGITLGLASPQLGRFADKYPISKFSTVGIFFISGLMLRSEEIGAAIKAWPVGILGLVWSFFIPCLTHFEAFTFKDFHPVSDPIIHTDDLTSSLESSRVHHRLGHFLLHANDIVERSCIDTTCGRKFSSCSCNDSNI